jgi:pimeloyl-ACP methyl ester carboxylesterase
MIAPALDLSADASLSSHVAAIGGLIAQSFSPVLLVGHSYGAAVAHIAASRWADRVSGLMCLDGFVLRPGQAVIDLVPPRIRAEWFASGEMVPPLPVEVMAVNEADRAWLTAKLQPHPLGCFTEPAPAEPAFEGPRLYLRATGFAFPPFDKIKARLRQEGWRVDSIATGHDVMLAAPGQIKNMLIKNDL